jgi:hypothetical protein
VCDGKASLCPAWEIHCHAFPSQEWKHARAKWKREAAQRKANGGAVSAASVGHVALFGAAVGGTCKCTHTCSPALMFMKYTFLEDAVKTTYSYTYVAASYTRISHMKYAANFKCVGCKKIPPQPFRANLGKQMFGALFVEGGTVLAANEYNPTDRTKMEKERTMIVKERQAVENSLWKHMKQRGGDAERNNVDAVVSCVRLLMMFNCLNKLCVTLI